MTFFILNCLSFILKSNIFQVCNTCGENLPLIKYKWQKNRPNPRKICNLCKSRRDNKNLSPERILKKKEYRKEYRISGRLKDAWEKNKYGVCKKELDYNHCLICGSEKRLHIDHCHKTGKFRALLCSKCNTGLGMFDEDIAKMECAIRYIKHWLKYENFDNIENNRI